MAACAALCIGLLPQMAGLSSGGGNSTGAAPAQRLGVPGRFLHSRCPVPYAAGGESSPSAEAPLQQCGPSGSRGHRPDGGGVPASIAPFSLQEQGAGAPEDFSALAPALSEALAGQLGPESRPAAPVLHHSRGTGGPGLAGDGRLSLDRPGGGGGPLPAGRPDRQAAALWESGVEGPAVALVYP